MNLISKSSLLVLYYETENNISILRRLNPDSVENVDLKHTFDKTSGKYENIQSIAIKLSMFFEKKEDITNQVFPTWATFIWPTISSHNVTKQVESYLLTQRHRKYYKELSSEYDSIENDRM